MGTTRARVAGVGKGVPVTATLGEVVKSKQVKEKVRQGGTYGTEVGKGEKEGA